MEFDKRESGFTLIEISIVIVIIGLLVGGILVGRDLVRSAEIRAQIKQIQQFKTATNTFISKYGYLPGDIPPTDTTSLGFFTFTGALAGRSNNVSDPPYGFARYGYGDNSGDIQETESYVFWQHLSEAQLIEGKYGGSTSLGLYLQADTSATYYEVGLPTDGTSVVWVTDITSPYFFPKSKVYTYYGVGVATNRTHTRNDTYKNIAARKNPNYFNIGVTPHQVYSMDTKIDDGMPSSGSVQCMGNTSPCLIVSTNPYTYDRVTDPDQINMCVAAFFW